MSRTKGHQKSRSVDEVQGEKTHNKFLEQLHSRDRDFKIKKTEGEEEKKEGERPGAGEPARKQGLA